jgi:hypothetical protein
LVASGGFPVLRAPFPAGPVETDLGRAPFFVGARLGAAFSGFRASLETAAGASWLMVERRDGRGEDAALEPGLRAGGVLSLDTPITPQLGVRAEFVPAPHSLALDPTGGVGQTPTVWIGATVGCAFGLW